MPQLKQLEWKLRLLQFSLRLSMSQFWIHPHALASISFHLRLGGRSRIRMPWMTSASRQVLQLYPEGRTYHQARNWKWGSADYFYWSRATPTSRWGRQSLRFYGCLTKRLCGSGLVGAPHPLDGMQFCRDPMLTLEWATHLHFPNVLRRHHHCDFDRPCYPDSFGTYSVLASGWTKDWSGR